MKNYQEKKSYILFFSQETFIMLNYPRIYEKEHNDQIYQLCQIWNRHETTGHSKSNTNINEYTVSLLLRAQKKVSKIEHDRLAFNTGIPFIETKVRLNVIHSRIKLEFNFEV